MKSFTQYISEKLSESKEVVLDNEINESEEEMTESEFKEYAKELFTKAFGNELDTDQMDKIVDGILSEDIPMGEKIGKLKKGVCGGN